MKKLYLIYLNILIIFLIGCGGSTGETELKHPDKSPESLNDVSSGIDDIGSSLDEIERLVMNIPLVDEEDEMEDSHEHEEGQEQEQSQEEQGSINSQENHQDEDGQQQPQQPQEPQQSQEQPKSEEKIKNEKIKKAWEHIEKKIEEIHGAWNEYEVEGQKKGVTREQLDLFDNGLNKLTMWVTERNLAESYDAISQTYLSLRPLFDLYLDDIMAELTSLKYDTYRAYTMGINNSEDSNFEIFENNEDLYNRIKHKLDDESKNDLINRLENSINSLKKGLKEDSRRVNMIKKNIVLENIKELEE